MKPLLQETIKGTFRFLETKPNQFLKTEKKSDCTLKRSSSFEDKSYARRLAPSFCSSWFRGMGGHKLEINTFGLCRILAERSRMSGVESEKAAFHSP